MYTMIRNRIRRIYTTKKRIIKEIKKDLRKVEYVYGKNSYEYQYYMNKEVKELDIIKTLTVKDILESE